MDYKKTLPLIACLLIAGGIVVYKYSSRAPEKSTTTGHTILVQATLNMPMLSELENAITPIANAIIKEETGLDNAFTPKSEHRLTLYYVEDLSDAGIPEIEKTATAIINEHKSACIVKNTTFAYDARFFGDAFDELVIMANDQHHELAALNTLFKDAFHALNTANRVHYNIQKSERYGYNPHVSFGKMDLAGIKNALKNSPDANGVIERIRARIIDEMLRLEREVTKNQPAHISFATMQIFDTNTRTAIKIIPLT